MKIVSGGGLASNKLVQSRSAKTEPKSHKVSVPAIAQIGRAVQFEKPKLEAGRGLQPKGPTSNLGQGPGANRVLHPHGSQQRTPEAREMPKGRDTLREFGRDIPGRK
jgi:hypothetical protein